MGSIGDIVICKEAGHQAPENRAELNALNVRLQELVHSLYLVANGLLGEVQ